MKQVILDTIKMVQKETEKGMVSPPEVVSKAIKKIRELELPCENDEVEVLCDECPFNILPKLDCGLAVLRERAKMLKPEGESQ